MSDLTLEEQATNAETWKHINRVQALLAIVTQRLTHRAVAHDQSKLASPEVELFTEFTPKLKKSTYGSEEYEGFRKEMGAALDHHYANNSHHPEFYKNGVDDMDLLDIIEMLCDWKAASERHNDGNILKSIETNKQRFNLSDQMTKILENTARTLFNIES